MLFEIYYDDLPEEVKDILVEGDVASNHLVRLKDKIILALRYHALIPDGGIEMVRITNEDDYERLIDIKTQIHLQTLKVNSLPGAGKLGTRVRYKQQIRHKPSR